jgi:hypothetical protein
VACATKRGEHLSHEEGEGSSKIEEQEWNKEKEVKTECSHFLDELRIR